MQGDEKFQDFLDRRLQELSIEVVEAHQLSLHRLETENGSLQKDIAGLQQGAGMQSQSPNGSNHSGSPANAVSTQGAAPTWTAPLHPAPPSTPPALLPAPPSTMQAPVSPASSLHSAPMMLPGMQDDPRDSVDSSRKNSTSPTNKRAEAKRVEFSVDGSCPVSAQEDSYMMDGGDSSALTTAYTRRGSNDSHQSDASCGPEIQKKMSTVSTRSGVADLVGKVGKCSQCGKPRNRGCTCEAWASKASRGGFKKKESTVSVLASSPSMAGGNSPLAGSQSFAGSLNGSFTPGSPNGSFTPDAQPQARRFSKVRESIAALKGMKGAAPPKVRMEKLIKETVAAANATSGDEPPTQQAPQVQRKLSGVKRVSGAKRLSGLSQAKRESGDAAFKPALSNQSGVKSVESNDPAFKPLRSLQFKEQESEVYSPDGDSEGVKTPPPDTNGDHKPSYEGRKSRKTYRGGSIMSDEDEDEDDDVFRLCAVWAVTGKTSIPAKNMSRSTSHDFPKSIYGDHGHGQDNHDSHGGQLRWWDRIVIHQASVLHLIWGFMIGFIFVGWDTVTVPLQFFDPPENELTQTVQHTARIYWTFDIIAQFLTVKHESLSDHGPPTCRTRASEYFKSWFSFDITILTIDWVDLFIDVNTEKIDCGASCSNSNSLLRFLRVLRIVRLLRLIRLLRTAPEFTRSIAYYVRSDVIFVFVGVTKILMLVLAITHMIACAWYGVGKYLNDGNSWVELLQLASDEVDLGTRYLASFYYSLIAFTGVGALESENNWEMIFALAVTLMAFLMSVSIVSSLTTLMTRLQLATAKQAQQFSVLHRFLIDHKISHTLASRVERNAQYAVTEMMKNTTESSVELLSIISNPLRVELHYEVFSKLLVNHPFFFHYDLCNPSAMRQVTHQALMELQVSRGDVIFSSGELLDDPDMFFVKSGVLEYLLPGDPKKEITTSGWIAEPVLWVQSWVHNGVLRAQSECQLLLLCACRFQSTASNFKNKEFLSSKYANAFLEELNKVEKDMLSEVAEEMMSIEEICKSVFRDRMMSSSVRQSLHPGSKMAFLLKRGMSKIEGNGKREGGSWASSKSLSVWSSIGMPKITESEQCDEFKEIAPIRESQAMNFKTSLSSPL